MSSTGKEKELAGTEMLRRKSARTHTRQERDGSKAKPIVISESPQPKPGYSPKDTIASRDDRNTSSVTTLSATLPSQLPGLSKKGVQLLRSKQELLKSPQSQINNLSDFCDPKLSGFQALREAVDATLVFAQEEAGTAVCISKTGLLLTCSHCVAESLEELDLDKIWWLLFASGQVVQAKTVKWDPRRDLALLQTVAIQPRTLAGSLTHFTSSHEAEKVEEALPRLEDFPVAQLGSKAPKVRTLLLCIGHPGSEDLEVGRPGVATGYDVLHISDGRFKGYAKGQDVQDNSEIGALMHDCWTYWGHSGAPLLDVKSGALIGLHSSWDDKTAMRRGVGWEALRDFLGEYEAEKNDEK